ncbi:MAG TPA: ATP-binding protein [Flavitalea sp.]|nr:ATP-binding protein [Flavitalea sp.]
MINDIDTAPCLYLIFSDDGIIITVNQFLCETLGYKKDELTDHHLDKLFPVPTLIFYNTHVFPLIRMAGRISEIFMFLKAKSGSQIPVLVNGVRSGEPESINTFVAIVVENRNKFEQELISAKKTAEKTLRDNEALLAAQASLKKKSLELDNALSDLKSQHQELTQLNKVVTHDLEEPIRKLFFYTDELLNKADYEKNMLAGVDKIVEATHRLKSVVSALQEYIWVTEENASPANIDITGIIDKCIQELTSVHDMSKVRIETSDIPVCSGDQLLIHKLFLHILDNAIRYSKPGEDNVISIRGNIIKRNVFRITGENYDYVSYVRIEICDKGRGFYVADQSNPFELFKKLHQHNGVGVGLAVAKKIAEKHQGYINVDSKLGEGTRIEVFLLPGKNAEANR